MSVSYEKSFCKNGFSISKENYFSAPINVTQCMHTIDSF